MRLKIVFFQVVDRYPARRSQIVVEYVIVREKDKREGGTTIIKEKPMKRQIQRIVVEKIFFKVQELFDCNFQAGFLAHFAFQSGFDPFSNLDAPTG